MVRFFLLCQFCREFLEQNIEWPAFPPYLFCRFPLDYTGPGWHRPSLGHLERGRIGWFWDRLPVIQVGKRGTKRRRNKGSWVSHGEPAAQFPQTPPYKGG